MVYLAITRQCLHDLLAVSAVTGVPVWCGSDALSDDEFEQLNQGKITRFNYPLADADRSTFEDALGTIAEHHPGQHIWVESVALCSAETGI